MNADVGVLKKDYTKDVRQTKALTKLSVKLPQYLSHSIRQTTAMPTHGRVGLKAFFADEFPYHHHLGRLPKVPLQKKAHLQL